MPAAAPVDDSHLRDPVRLKRWKRRCLDKGREIARKIEQIMNGLEVRLEDVKLGPDQKPGETPLERLRRFLALVDGVVKSFDKGTYGRCRDCAAPIPEARLEETPWSVRCAPCHDKALREGVL